MTETFAFQAGDRLTIETPGGRRVPARVKLISGHFRALLLEVDDRLVGGWVGGVPVAWRDEQWITFDGTPVTLTRGHDDDA